MKVIVAPSARADLLGIWAYIAKDNVAAADRMCDRIYESFKQLDHSPRLGQLCTDLGFDLRRYVVGS